MQIIHFLKTFNPINLGNIIVKDNKVVHQKLTFEVDPKFGKELNAHGRRTSFLEIESSENI
jgi:hypothetical protein